MHNIDIFDSYYMLGMVREVVPVPSFFRERYFPTNEATDVFKSNKVLIEYKDGDRKIAPFVAERVGDIPVGRGGYQMKEYEPPSIKPSRFLTLDDLNKRGFGEALLSGSTQAERAKAMQLEDLKDLNARIGGREEWMAANTMINNGCSVVEYLDYKTVGRTVDIYYYDTAKGNPATYTPAKPWNNGGDMFLDVEAMCTSLAESGVDAADLVLGTDSGQHFLSDEKMQKLLDNRRMEFGRIAPEIKVPGVTWYGRVNFNGFELDVFCVRESYEDENGVRQKFFPEKSAMVTAPGCGRMVYAQITQMNPDGEYETFAQKRVPKLILDQNEDTRKLRLSARPLAVPRKKSPWRYAKNVVE